MIVDKAVKMAERMKVCIIKLLENMSYFWCPDNGKEHQTFRERHIEQVAAKHHMDVLVKMPIDPLISEHCDKGSIEEYELSCGTNPRITEQ